MLPALFQYIMNRHTLYSEGTWTELQFKTTKTFTNISGSQTTGPVTCKNMLVSD